MKTGYRLFFLLLFPALILNSCKKDQIDPGDEYDAEAQLAADEVLIKAFIAKNSIPAQRHETGVYYQIIAPGEGNITYNSSTTITVNYTLRDLNGKVIEQSSQPYRNLLSRLIPAWQIGVPLIQKGGKIRLISPSGYAYGPYASGNLPPNSILDFDIELVDVQN